MRRWIVRLAWVPAFILSVGGVQPHTTKQLVAHRGASAYAPEHTLEAYRLALEQGADFVEQDLGVTKDGVLVCLHDATLERTTDVEQVFPDRYAPETNERAGAPRWFVNDFTLTEIKRLDAGSWFGPEFAGARVPTFQEAIDLVRGKAGLYPELKDPELYRTRGIYTDVLLAALLKTNSLVDDPRTPVILQSFDETTLKRLAKELPAVPRVLLVAEGDRGRLDGPDKVRGISGWATGLGPEKAIVESQPALVRWAHDAGLTVTPWTFRSSTIGKYPSVRDEMRRFLFEYGVDAVFTDNPDQFPRR